MKFGGSSVADSDRIRAVSEIVRARAERRPLLVVSALAGVTDLLQRAVELAASGDREGLDPVVAEIERRHRWAIAGSVEDAGRRHDLSLEVDGLIENIRRRLRSIRILGEATARAADAVLALGEDLSSRLVAAALRDRGTEAQAVDPRELLVTDARFGSAEVQLEPSRAACRERLLPLLDAGTLPVVGGFVGATAEAETTTLGRGGSDTSAALFGLLLGAEELQIWTDVDGLMSADPRLVPAARRLARVSFAEAAELACHGARVLHPDSIAPAVHERIPVRVLNSLRPESEGTLVVEGDPAGDDPRPVAVASRRGVDLLRLRSRRMRGDPALLSRVLAVCAERGASAQLVASSTLAATLALGAGRELREALEAEADVELLPDRAIIWVVGSGLASDAALRRRVIEGLSHWQPELLSAGVSSTSVAAVVAGERLEACLRELHRRFFEDAE